MTTQTTPQTAEGRFRTQPKASVRGCHWVEVIFSTLPMLTSPDCASFDDQLRVYTHLLVTRSLPGALIKTLTEASG